MKNLALLLGLLFCAPALALDGKWTPQQVLELNPAWLKKQGLELPPHQLWDAAKGRGLLSNAVKVGGCSGAFVSATGLVITNHHCVVSILQQHATPENHLFQNGHLARSKEEEKPGKAIRISVPRRFTEVTPQVLAAIPEGADDLARYRAIERQQKALVAQCEAQPHTRCHFAAYDGGLFYGLTEYFELADVRLVYAPPLSVGEFGGEVDNWMWPRHTGDFALLRAYVDSSGHPAPFSPDNVPYRPEFFFPLSTEGVKPGDFVAVLGYPGMTVRALLTEEMAERQERLLPSIRDLYSEWIALIEQHTAGRPAGEIALADFVKTLKNRRKNAQGQLDGLARGNILARQRAQEEAVVAWLQNAGPALAAREELRALHQKRRATFERDFLLDQSLLGSRALAWSLTLARRASEGQKPDLEREPEFMDRELPRLKERLERDHQRLDLQVDKALLQSWLARAMALPSEQQLAPLVQWLGPRPTPAQLRKKVDQLYARSKLLGLSERMKMFDESPQALRARQDPWLLLAMALDEERRKLKEQKDAYAGAVFRLRPPWRKAVIAHAGKPIAPDANGTLRVSLAHVRGYQPRDGVAYLPQTTLAGALAKHTGVAPFDLPEKIRQAASQPGRWKDPALGDVPLCFLSDADTTGGNSGSPTIDGKGRLVGVNFDRVWENVANDFGYNPQVARNVNVDVRYLLWMLERVERAVGLLEELGVAKTPSPHGGKIL